MVAKTIALTLTCNDDNDSMDENLPQNMLLIISRFQRAFPVTSATLHRENLYRCVPATYFNQGTANLTICFFNCNSVPI